MKFSLSTNWCNRKIESGEEIADKAIALGFEELELGFHTTQEQVKGFKSRLGQIPVGSIHAFCPVPISAPQGYPELYPLASFDENERGLARVHVRRNVEFAAEMGADTVVLHAGRVMCRGFLRRWDMKRRVKRGKKLVEVFKRELELMVPVLEKHKVTLGLENLPYLEGFPAEWEMKGLVGDWVRPWLDTGHEFVRRTNQWTDHSVTSGEDAASPLGAASPLDSVSTLLQPVGLHVNDSQGGDDHLPPGEGQVDFAALKTFAENARHVVFEPNSTVTEEGLRNGLAFIRELWISRDRPQAAHH